MTDQNISEKLMRERQLALELLNTKANKSGKTGDSFNISAFYADRTQEVQLTPSKSESNTNNNEAGCDFEPKEISGRSTDINQSFRLRHFVTPGLDEIFATSICDDVREIGRSMSRLSRGSIPRTEDIDRSPASSESTGDWNERGYNKDWLVDAVNAPQVDFDEEFEGGGESNPLSKIIHDQHDWEKEYADIPSVSPPPAKDGELFKLPDIPKIKAKLTNHADLGDFSGYLEVANETAKAFEESRQNFSMGLYFLKNSNNLEEICHDKSPPKRDAVPLIDTMTEHSWLKEVPEPVEACENKENSDPNNVSISTIMKVMKTLNLNDTPHTVLHKFSMAKQSKPVERGDILSSTIKSTEGPINPFETESVTSLNEDVPARKETLGITDDSGKGQTLSSQNMIRTPLTPRTKHSKHEQILNSPCSIASSLERTDDHERAMLTGTHSGKFSLPAYPLTRTTSQCSSTSEFRSLDGQFPIKTSCKELSWNCVKLQEKVEKELTIKNVCDRKVSIMVSISGPGFQSSVIGKQRLERFECRKLKIEFCPTVKGLACGFLSFELMNSTPEMVRNVHLFGFGGKSDIRVRGLEIPPSGDKYLCMGTMRDLNGTMEQYIQIGNRGDCDAFVLVALECDTKSFNMNFLPTLLLITPQRLQLPGKKMGSVKLSFTPTREEARYIYNQPQEMVPIARVNVIYGDWATRKRLQRVCHVLRQKLDSNVSIQKICQPFKGETPDETSPEQFLDDPWKAFQECTDTFQHTEFVLTINKSADETLNLTQTIAEQSILFKSMLTDELRHYRNDSDTFPLQVTPSHITIGRNETVNIQIRNVSGRTETFEIGHELNGYIFEPNEGQLRPEETVEVKLRLAHGPPGMTDNFSIFVSNGKLTVPVTVDRKSFFK